MNVTAHVKSVHPVVWVALAVVAGVGVMSYHLWVPTEDDSDWLDPQQPPTNVDVPIQDVPAGCVSPPFRARSYKGDLTANRGARPTILGML